MATKLPRLVAMGREAVNRKDDKKSRGSVVKGGVGGSDRRPAG